MKSAAPFRIVESLPRRQRHDPLLWFLLGLTIAGDLASVASLICWFALR